MDDGMKVAVVGAGAIGGACAGLIQQQGHRVCVVVRRSEQARAINRNGISVTGVKTCRIKVQALEQVADLPEDLDAILLACKATDMLEICHQIPPGVTAPVVSLQNGLCEDALAEILGRDRVIGCVTGWGATMVSDTEFEMTSQGEFVIGNIDGEEDLRLPGIQVLLNPVCSTRISSKITAALYSKLIINACITSVGAVCGLYLGEMLSRAHVRAIFLKIMEEAIAVAHAMELKVPAYEGRLDYYRFVKDNGLLGRIKRRIILGVMGRKFRRLKSSSLQSLERGRKTEVDYLTGYITQKGDALGVPTPVNDQILAVIKEIESGKRTISETNLTDIRIQ